MFQNTYTECIEIVLKQYKKSVFFYETVNPVTMLYLMSQFIVTCGNIIKHVSTQGDFSLIFGFGFVRICPNYYVKLHA